MACQPELGSVDLGPAIQAVSTGRKKKKVIGTKEIDGYLNLWRDDEIVGDCWESIDDLFFFPFHPLKMLKLLEVFDLFKYFYAHSVRRIRSNTEGPVTLGKFVDIEKSNSDRVRVLVRDVLVGFYIVACLLVWLLTERQWKTLGRKER